MVHTVGEPHETPSGVALGPWDSEASPSHGLPCQLKTAEYALYVESTATHARIDAHDMSAEPEMS